MPAANLIESVLKEERCVVVIGDVMFDETVHVVRSTVGRASVAQEAIFEVVRDTTNRLVTLGGSGAMARGACCVCDVHLVVAGRDNEVEQAAERFNRGRSNRTNTLHVLTLRDNDRPWTRKTRYYLARHAIARVDDEERAELPSHVISALQQSFDRIPWDRVGACLFADFGKGFLTPQVIAATFERCHHGQSEVAVLVAAKKEAVGKYLGRDMTFVLRSDAVQSIARLSGMGREPLQEPDYAALVSPGRLVLVEEPTKTTRLGATYYVPKVARSETTTFELSTADNYQIAAFSLFVGLLAGATARGAELSDAIRVASLGTQALDAQDEFSDIDYRASLSGRSLPGSQRTRSLERPAASWFIPEIARAGCKINLKRARTEIPGWHTLSRTKKELAQKAKEWVDGVAAGQSRRGLLIWGSSGDGKTVFADRLQHLLLSLGCPSAELETLDCTKLTGQTLCDIAEKLRGSPAQRVVRLDEIDKAPLSPGTAAEWQKSWMTVLEPGQGRGATAIVIATGTFPSLPVGHWIQTTRPDLRPDFFTRLELLQMPTFADQMCDLAVGIAAQLSARGITILQAGALARLLDCTPASWRDVQAACERATAGLVHGMPLTIDHVAKHLATGPGARPFENNEQWIEIVEAD